MAQVNLESWVSRDLSKEFPLVLKKGSGVREGDIGEQKCWAKWIVNWQVWIKHVMFYALELREAREKSPYSQEAYILNKHITT